MLIPFRSNERNALKFTLKILPTPLQNSFFDFAGMMLESKLKENIRKKKAEKLHSIQKHNVKQPKGTFFKLKAKSYAKKRC